MRIVDNGRRPLLEVICHLLFARLASARGDDVVVDVHLERARGVIPEAAPPVVAHIDRVQLRHELRRGDVVAAESVLGRLPPSVRDGSPRRPACAWCAGDDARRRDVLVRVADLATPRLHIEHRILTALATADRDLDAAHAFVHDALGVARTMGWQQTIVDEGPALWGLLRSLPAIGATRRLRRRAACRRRRAVPPAHALVDQRDLVEPLSERELTVLRYLSSRLDASEIAAALYLSVNTVRSHVKAIYRKLGVNARAEAVRRGRELGLI